MSGRPVNDTIWFRLPKYLGKCPVNRVFPQINCHCMVKCFCSQVIFFVEHVLKVENQKVNDRTASRMTEPKVE